jgi:hypothetical protein
LADWFVGCLVGWLVLGSFLLDGRKFCWLFFVWVFGWLVVLGFFFVWMVCSLIGWCFGWLADWFVGCLIVWLVLGSFLLDVTKFCWLFFVSMFGWLVVLGFFFGWMVSSLIGWCFGWLADWFVGRLVG